MGRDRDFGSARRAAFVARLVRRLGRAVGRGPCCESLRGFSEELARRGLRRGRTVSETVELDRIVGSVGRRGAFDPWFLPLCSCSRERWERVHAAFLEGRFLPPVELYKLDGAYYVADGHHRVSVSRHLGVAAVDAVVVEFA